MKTATDQLIDDLAQDLSPVRRIPRLRTACAGVAGSWLLAVGVAWILGVAHPQVGRGAPWGDLTFLAVTVGLALVAAGAMPTALAGAVPGRADAVNGGGAVVLLGLLLAAGAGVWAVATSAPAGVSQLRSTLPCVTLAGALALAPVMLASLFLARGVARHPLVSAGCAAVGTVALGSLVVHLGCRGGGALHVLVGHALAPLFLGLALAAPIGLLVRRWNQRA